MAMIAPFVGLVDASLAAQGAGLAPHASTVTATTQWKGPGSIAMGNHVCIVPGG